MALKSARPALDAQTVQTYLELQHVVPVVGHTQPEGVHGG